jgi:hypothetical protein
VSQQWTGGPCEDGLGARGSASAGDEESLLAQREAVRPSSTSSDGRLRHTVRFGQADDWAAAIKRRSAPDCPGPYAIVP